MLFGFVIGWMLIPLTGNFLVLTGLLFVLGLCEGVLDLGSNVLLLWLRRENANPFLNALHFFFGLGALISPIFVAQALLRTGGITTAFWLLALYPLPVALGLLRLPSPAPQHNAEEHLAQHGPVDVLLVTLLSLIFWLYVGAELGFGNWIYTYTLTMGLGDIASAGYLTSAFWAALMVGRLISVPLATRLRPVPMLIGDMLGCLLSLGIILAFPSAYWAIWAGTIGLGLSMASFFPTLLVYAGLSLPTSGQVTRWFFVGTGLGGMVLPWLLGVLAEQYGPEIIMPVILLDVLMVLVLFLVCNRRVQKQLNKGVSQKNLLGNSPG
jgi:MFS transporter, FHS family, Na+ dependent glucose transporter 1